MFDHCDYSNRFENTEEEECDDGLDVFNHQNSFNKYIKFGDKLLIDMVRSRPYLYDKSVENYKDTTMKENAWTEIATALNITLAECKNRWIRFRQRYSKERQL
ncbi:Transcription factor Adf-1 [Formica fusca]